MSRRPESLHVVSQWVAKADEDLTAAEYLLTMVEGCPFATACFHAQQCAEKYFKALLALHSIPFPKTHDLAELAAALPAVLKLPVGPAEIGLLKRYSVETRYPGDWDPVTRQDAEEAIRLARNIRDAVRVQIPIPPTPPVAGG